MTFSKSVGEIMFEQSRIAELVHQKTGQIKKWYPGCRTQTRGKIADDDDAIVPEGVIFMTSDFGVI